MSENHLTLEEKRREAKRQLRDMEVEFQAAKDHLAICQAAAKSGTDGAVMKAHDRWGNAAANYSAALTHYSNLLINRRAK